MIDPQYVVSSPNRERALPYIQDRLKASLLAQTLGTAFPERGSLKLVTTLDPPPGVDYFTDWSNTSCVDWLVTEIVGHLNATPQGVVLFEDMVSSPSDSYLSTHRHPAYWCYENRLFWPILAKDATPHSIEQVIAWSANTRTVAAFSVLPKDFSVSPDTPLSHVDFRQVASSLTRLVTDVFDGGGYMVWERENA